MQNVANKWFKSTGGIDRKEVYKDLSFEMIKKLDDGCDIADVINWIKLEVCQEYLKRSNKQLTDGALNNCIGAWNEYVVASYLTYFSLKFNESSESKIVIITDLPATIVKNGSTFLKLFRDDEFEFGQSLHPLKEIKKQIFFPSPDLIVLSLSKTFYESNNINALLDEQAQTPYQSNLYPVLKGQIKTSNILSIASLKTSYRPDRRYQPLFETAMIKAIAYGLEQNWKYCMIASKVSTSDEILFNNLISPHEIVMKYLGVENTSTCFVDKTYIYKDKGSLEKIFRELITKI